MLVGVGLPEGRDRSYMWECIIIIQVIITQYREERHPGNLWLYLMQIAPVSRFNILESKPCFPKNWKVFIPILQLGYLLNHKGYLNKSSPGSSSSSSSSGCGSSGSCWSFSFPNALRETISCPSIHPAHTKLICFRVLLIS